MSVVLFESKEMGTETETSKDTGEIEPLLQDNREDEGTRSRDRLYRQDQNQLEVRDILEKYGLKSIYAFSTQSGRGVPIRFHPRNGRSIPGYKDGSVVHIDGEPKDSLIKPITKILVGIAALTLLITLLVKDTPKWMKKFNILAGDFPPWVLACVVIVFTHMRKRTKDALKKFGW
ncbi:uncharacterized protein LOC120199012 [Hibiscus syriacus]|uniref:uncharacterized protein LOC120199012 n=1 Tax=Hibiscus syriacus TaxID=106335 RepID=UPI001923AAA5|nr:uncharacterized protein LOC120199012 [Hibiscus syriacus]